MTTAIWVEGVGKRYVLGRALDPHGTMREALAGAAATAVRNAGALLGRRHDPPRSEEFWALSDVSFDVARGEAIGLIGGNGAGKSTLLKILSRITAPTTGRVEIRGRVGSLLEVGTGFHPDLSGRENVYLNGAILGMRRAEIERKFDEIVAFAEVDRFIDTPVKRYSSGMYLRLAFAVAAHLEPEVLLVDEVLAVGDAAFQKKCLGKMGDVTAEGRTVLFVSHNMDSIQRLCARSILLEGGRVGAIGPTADVAAGYLLQASRFTAAGEWVDVSRLPRRGSGDARFLALRYSSTDDRHGGSPYTSGPLAFSLDIASDSARSVHSLAAMIRHPDGTRLVNAEIATHGQVIGLQAGRNRVRLELEALYLKPGEYTVDLWLGDRDGSALDHIESAATMRVLDDRPLMRGTMPAVPGVVPCTLTATVTAVDDGGPAFPP